MFSPWVILSAASDRALLSLTTVPTLSGWIHTAVVTGATTAAAGLVAAGSGFIDPVRDFDPPWQTKANDNENGRTTAPTHRLLLPWYVKSLSAFVFPSLGEEVLWRGAMIAPHPSAWTPATVSIFLPRAGVVLLVHVLLHPVAGLTVWPRGREVFCDPRFLALATIVLGGSTVAYVASGGSAIAASLTHGVCVVLWRDFFGGEAKLMRGTTTPTSNTDGVISEKKKEK